MQGETQEQKEIREALEELERISQSISKIMSDPKRQAQLDKLTQGDDRERQERN